MQLSFSCQVESNLKSLYLQKTQQPYLQISPFIIIYVSVLQLIISEISVIKTKTNTCY